MPSVTINAPDGKTLTVPFTGTPPTQAEMGDIVDHYMATQGTRAPAASPPSFMAQMLGNIAPAVSPHVAPSTTPAPTPVPTAPLPRTNLYAPGGAAQRNASSPTPGQSVIGNFAGDVASLPVLGGEAIAKGIYDTGADYAAGGARMMTQPGVTNKVQGFVARTTGRMLQAAVRAPGAIVDTAKQGATILGEGAAAQQGNLSGKPVVSDADRSAALNLITSQPPVQAATAAVQYATGNKAAASKSIAQLGPEFWQDPVGFVASWLPVAHGAVSAAHLTETAIRGAAIDSASAGLKEAINNPAAPPAIRQAAQQQLTKLQAAKGMIAQWQAAVEQHPSNLPQTAARNAATEPPTNTINVGMQPPPAPVPGYRMRPVQTPPVKPPDVPEPGTGTPTVPAPPMTANPQVTAIPAPADATAAPVPPPRETLTVAPTQPKPTPQAIPEPNPPITSSPEPATKVTPKPVYAGSVNLEKLSTPELQQHYTDRATRLGFDTQEPLTRQDAQNQARSLGVTTDALTRLPVGWKPSNVHFGVWQAAVRDVDDAAHVAESNARKAFAQNPTPENKATLDAATKTADATFARRSNLARQSGQAMNLLKNPSDPFVATKEGDIFAQQDSGPIVKRGMRRIPVADRVKSPTFGKSNTRYTPADTDAALSRIQARFRNTDTADLTDCKV